MKATDIAPWIAIAVTLILSILVPLFTQIANNKFQLKLKQLELREVHKKRKMDAFDEYYQKVGGCVLYAQKDNISDAGASIQRLYAYVPEDRWNELDELFDNIKGYNWQGAKNNMKSISKWLALEVQKTIDE